jgi:hypothetical protein
MRVNETQKFGAALSYAKRYALQGALNIVVTDEDTDACEPHGEHHHRRASHQIGGVD